MSCQTCKRYFVFTYFVRRKANSVPVVKFSFSTSTAKYKFVSQSHTSRIPNHFFLIAKKNSRVLSITKQIIYEREFYLFCFTEVSNMTIIIGSPHIKPSTCSLTAETGNQTGLCLSVGCIHSPNLHSTTNGFKQPTITAYTKPLQMDMQRSVPEKIRD